MSTTRFARRPVAAVAGQFELMLGLPPAADGQLDLVAAVADALEAPVAARRMAAELSASTGLRLRALPNGAITSAP